MTNRQIIQPPAELADKYMAFPAHEYEDGECLYCGQEPSQWATYEEYVAWWYAHEYEGEPGHEVDEREEWEFLQKTCLG